MKSILGKKIGMTQIFAEDGSVIPVTVVEAGPMFVTQVKTVENDGYNAIQCGYVDKKEKKVTKPLKGHFDKVSVGYKRFVREFRLNEGETFETGQEIKVDLFAEGDKVDVIGTSKGKGTQGAIKRWNYGEVLKDMVLNLIELPELEVQVLIQVEFLKVEKQVEKQEIKRVLFKILLL